MRPLPLDPNTTDRLLGGALQPDDAPPGYAEVARLVQAVTAEPSPGELARRDEAVAVMAGTLGTHHVDRRAARSGTPSLVRAKVAALLVGVSMLSSTSLALAGALPAPAQRAASAILADVGLDAPRHADPAALLGPTGSWLCRLEGRVSGDGPGAAPSRELPEASQVAGQTLQEFCAGVTPARVPGSHRTPLPTAS